MIHSRYKIGYTYSVRWMYLPQLPVFSLHAAKSLIVIYVLKFSCRSIVMCSFIMISKTVSEKARKRVIHRNKLPLSQSRMRNSNKCQSNKIFLFESVALFNIYFMDNRLGSFYALNGCRSIFPFFVLISHLCLVLLLFVTPKPNHTMNQMIPQMEIDLYLFKSLL